MPNPSTVAAEEEWPRHKALKLWNEITQTFGMKNDVLPEDVILAMKLERNKAIVASVQLKLQDYTKNLKANGYVGPETHDSVHRLHTAAGYQQTVT